MLTKVNFFFTVEKINKSLKKEQKRDKSLFFNLLFCFLSKN